VVAAPTTGACVADVTLTGGAHRPPMRPHLTYAVLAVLAALLLAGCGVPWVRVPG